MTTTIPAEATMTDDVVLDATAGNHALTDVVSPSLTSYEMSIDCLP